MRYFVETLPRHLLSGAGEALSGTRLATLVASGGAAGLLTLADGEVHGYFTRDRSSENPRRRLGHTPGEIGVTLGLPATLFGMAGGIYALGVVTREPRTQETAELALESLLLVGGTGQALKVVTQRERPDRSNRLSFPSLHAGGSFAFATTLDGQYGWRVGVPAYLLAAFISVARIQDQKHFLSDTVFGAGLGTVMALGVRQVHRRAAPPRVQVLPLVARNLAGLLVHVDF
ncbi:MAG: phosphatase PAP2 family protein [Deltaproteobacteria bacterium]|nr:phosphatase PAP2 family protein [Deltaproteobacteria bacterium]